MGTYNVTFVNATDNESINSEYTTGHTFTVVERSAAPGPAGGGGGGGGTPPMTFGTVIPFAVAPQKFEIASILGDTEVRELIIKNTMENTTMNRFEQIQVRLIFPVDGKLMQVPALYQYVTLSPQKEERIPITFKVPNKKVTETGIIRALASYKGSSDTIEIAVDLTGIDCKGTGETADRIEECCSFFVENGICVSKMGPITVRQQGVLAFIIQILKGIIAMLQALLGQ